MLDTLQHALAYLAQGWSIIPLVERTKRPAVKLAPYLSGAERLTADAAVAYWSEHPNAGIAILTGAPSGLVVVDVDPRNGGNCDEVEKAAPSRTRVRTGSGGLHMYFKHPGVGPIACGRTERPGVDRKGDGGYVVAPPSLHPDTGQPYEWLETAAALELVPEWVLRTPAPGQGVDGEERPHWIAEVFQSPQSLVSGTQRDTLVRLAWWLSAQHPPDIARGMLYMFTSKLTCWKDGEPWTSAQVDTILDSAYEKRAAQGYTHSFDTVLSPGTGATSSTAVAVKAEFFARLDARVTCGSEEWAPSVEPEWIVEALASPACFTEIVGEVKQGKSTLTAQLIRSVLTGEKLLQFATQQSPVVLYTEQERPSLKLTLARAGIHNHPGLNFLTLSDGLGIPWAVIAEWMIARCLKVGSRLLIIDTLTQLAGIQGRDENDSGAVAVIEPFQAAKLHGIACIFIRHGSKSAENRGNISRAGRGTTALTGAMDICAVHFQPGFDDVRCLRIGSRLREPFELTLEYRNGLYELVAEGRPETAAKKRTRTKWELARKAWDAGARTQAEMEKATGLARDTCRKRIEEFKRMDAGVMTELPADADSDPDTEPDTGENGE